MTEHEHAEVSRKLALAIEWDEEWRTHTFDSGFHVRLDDGTWRKFDYRDPLVIWPIAERFNCFPYFNPSTDRWNVGYPAYDTAALAVARAVIAAKEKA